MLRILFITFFLMAFLSSFDLYAEEDSIAETHDEVSEELEDFNYEIDRYLGGSAKKGLDYDSHIILGALSGYETRGGFIFHPDVNIRLVLPGTDRRFRLLFRSSESTPQSRRGNYLGKNSRHDPSSFDVGAKGLGLELQLIRKNKIKLVAQEYLRLHLKEWPEPVSRLLVVGEHPFNKFAIQYQTGPHWDYEYGFGLMLEPSFTLFPSKNLSIEFESNLYWLRKEGLSKEESVTMTGPISNLSALFIHHAFEYQMNPYRSQDLTYSFGYRRRLYYKWLTWQVTPALILDGLNDWKLVYRIATGIQISIGSNYSNITDFIAL